MSLRSGGDYDGECLCGAVRYRLRAAPPLGMFLCHCSRCRKESGTLHGANVFFSSGELDFERGEELLTRYALPGTRKRRWFCSICGSPMPRRTEDGGVVLPAGSLDDDGLLEPTAHIFCASEAGWADAAAKARRFPEGPE